MADVIIGATAALPFLGLVIFWSSRRPTRPSSLVGILVAAVMAVVILGVFTVVGGIGDPSPAMALPVFLAGAIAGIYGRRIGYREPEDSSKAH